MTDDVDEGDRDDGDGVPDSDPRHIDPAGDLADLVESGEFDIALDDDQDAEDLASSSGAPKPASSTPTPPSKRPSEWLGRS